MRNPLIPISAFCLSLTNFSGDTRPDWTVQGQVQASPKNFVVAENVQSIYDNIGLASAGLSFEAFNYAFTGYNNLINKHMITRADYLTICDMSQSSREKRMYVIDMQGDKLVMNTRVAHGRNSGGEFATRFSNKPESLQTSLGFFITQSTYIGGHGLSLKITGVDVGFNDKALSRNIVIHGAAYMEESWLRHSRYMGRSYGCPAVSQKECTSIINTIKNGTCLFIYHTDKNYLQGSKILNG